MPPTAQRLREPAAFVLLAFGAVSTFFITISFLFGPGDRGMSTFSSRAPGAVSGLLDPLIAAALVGAVWLAHHGTQLKAAKTISMVALITIGVAALFGLIAIFSTFGSEGATGWDKTTFFFIGIAKLGIDALAGLLILGWFQQHAPVRPAAPAFPPQQQPWGQPPQQQWQPQGQPGPAPQGVPGQQQWGTPAPQQQVPPQQQWGTPAPQPQGQPPQAPPQGGFQGGGTDSMMTQAIPTMGQPQNPPQPPAEGQGPFPVGNWTSE